MGPDPSNEIASFAKTGKFDFERLADSILNTMADLAAKLAVKELFGGLLGDGGGGGLLSGLFGGGGGGGFLAGLFSEGGVFDAGSDAQRRSRVCVRHAPHFAEGTANTSGIPSILHPNEAVIPLSKGRKIPVEMPSASTGEGGQTISYNPTYHINSPDVDGFRKTQKQVTAEGFSAAQRAAASNR